MYSNNTILRVTSPSDAPSALSTTQIAQKRAELANLLSSVTINGKTISSQIRRRPADAEAEVAKR